MTKAKYLFFAGLLLCSVVVFIVKMIGDYHRANPTIVKATVFVTYDTCVWRNQCWDCNMSKYQTDGYKIELLSNAELDSLFKNRKEP